MTMGKERMESTSLFLRQNELCVGMTVALCRQGEKEPIRGSQGQILVMTIVKLEGPMVHFFHEGSICVNLDATDHLATTTHRMAEFEDYFRFMPVQVFTTRDAPLDTDLAVFVDGKHLLYPGTGLWVSVRSKRSGHFLAAHQDCAEVRACSGGKEVFLPHHAVLVPTSGVGTLKPTVGVIRNVAFPRFR